MISAKKEREKNRMGKTRDSFKKIKDNKETFHAKMGSIKDRILGKTNTIMSSLKIK